MKFTWFAIHAHTAIVVDAVGDVAALLYLGYEGTATNGMHTTGRYEEGIAHTDRMLGQHLTNGTILYSAAIFLAGNAL